MSASARRLDILIAGAGIAGLATALALARHGIASTILERQPELTEAGAGIQLGPNATRVLIGLGLEGALAAAVQSPPALVVRHGLSGREIAQLPLGTWLAERHGAPYWVLRRADLQAALLAAVRGSPLITLALNWPVATWSADDRVALAATDGRVVRGDALIAADGLWSTIRRPAPPRPAGKSAWRALLDRQRCSGPLVADSVGIWFGRNGHIVHYPVAGGRLVNIVAIAADPRASTGWSEAADATEAGSHFAGWAEPLQQAFARPTEWRRWTLFDAEPLKRWNDGRILAIGDAAHPVLPFLAQGAGLTLEDAEAVAHHVAHAGGDIGAAFAAVSVERAARAARVAKAAHFNGRYYHFGGPFAWARDCVLAMSSPHRIMSSYDWLYGYRPSR